MLQNIVSAIGSAASPMTLILLIAGTGAGILIGAMPGLSVNMGIALLYPLTFAFDGVQGIIMLLGVYCGAIYGPGHRHLPPRHWTVIRWRTKWDSRDGRWGSPRRAVCSAVYFRQSV